MGWYHSHPGYGCWLSGIDCSTQMMQQKFQDPFLAIVVDPHRTVAAGKVEIGAFRTYPEARPPWSRQRGCALDVLCISYMAATGLSGTGGFRMCGAAHALQTGSCPYARHCTPPQTHTSRCWPR